MKTALLGFVLMGLAPAAVASAGDRYESRSHGGARFGLSINLGSRHSDRHHAPVVRHRPVVVDEHREVIVHDEYGDHAVVTEHRPVVVDRHDTYYSGNGGGHGRSHGYVSRRHDRYGH